MAISFHDNNRTGRAAIAVPVAVACVLQLALAPQVSILGGRFNFMVAVACALASGMPAGQAALLGFGCGLFYDLTSSVPVGLMSLLLTVGCFALSTMSNGMPLGFTTEGVRLPAAVILVVNLVYGLGCFLLGIDGSFVNALLVHGLACAVLDIVVCLPFIAVLQGGAAGFSARSRSSRGGRFKTPR